MAVKGNIPWNKGKRDIYSDETRKKMSESRKGRKASDETKRRMSEAGKGVPQPEGFGEKLRIMFTGRTYTEETHRRMSEAGKKRAAPSDEARKRMSLASKGKCKSLEHSANIQKAQKKYWGENPKPPTSEKTRKLLSLKSKENWGNQEYVYKVMANRKFYNRQHEMNKPESKLFALLQDNWPGEWKYVGNGEVRLGRKNPDFININGKKLIIEMFGDYWHRNHDPKDKENHYSKYGFKTLVIWEKELENIDLVKNRVCKLLKG